VGFKQTGVRSGQNTYQSDLRQSAAPLLYLLWWNPNEQRRTDTPAPVHPC